MRLEERIPVTTKAPFLAFVGLTTMGRSGSSAFTPRSMAPARVLNTPHDVLYSSNCDHFRRLDQCNVDVTTGEH